jgi:hypothetical protein
VVLAQVALVVIQDFQALAVGRVLVALVAFQVIAVVAYQDLVELQVLVVYQDLVARLAQVEYRVLVV